jgi:alkanesulfonate monooxygenase SsuD/methylene tetrahydromethanopterin reductase-like flavin-dependent oxidoreductase (luciferase family)
MTDIGIGVFLPTMSTPDRTPGDVVAAARHAEGLGFESVWVGDQLIAGTGVPILDSVTSLAAAAAVTERVKLGVGVLILPLRQIAWVAKQVASLQHISGDRVLLGVGVGNARHHDSWTAAGVSQRDRGRLADEALRVLPDLIAGRPTRLDQAPAERRIQLSPPATVPPVIVGGMSDAALRRAASVGDGWFTLSSPGDLPAERARLESLVAANRRPMPEVTTMATVAIHGDPSLPDHEELLRSVSDPDGIFGIPADHAEAAVVTGAPEAIARRLADRAADGVQRVVVMFAAGDWFRQAELLAEARQIVTGNS